MSSDPWPMIAGMGAGIAAAAAVGQMIVAAVALGKQDANQANLDGEIKVIKQDLERLQRALHEHGLDDTGESPSSDGKAGQARAQAMRVQSVSELRQMERALEEKVNDLIRERRAWAERQDQPQRQQQEKSWFTRKMEQRGRDFMGIK